LNTVLVVDSMLYHFAGNAGEESIIMYTDINWGGWVSGFTQFAECCSC